MCQKPAFLKPVLFKIKAGSVLINSLHSQLGRVKIWIRKPKTNAEVLFLKKQLIAILYVWHWAWEPRELSTLELQLHPL